MLLLGQCAEPVDFVLARRFPLVIRLERRLEVRLDVDVECLGLKLTIGGVVDAGNRFG